MLQTASIYYNEYHNDEC